MQYIIEHADEIEKLIKVKAQVSEVKSIMLDNIEKVRHTKRGIRDVAPWAFFPKKEKKGKKREVEDIPSFPHL